MRNVNEIIQLSDNYQARCLDLVKYARIRQLPNGKYRVLSQKGKNLGTYNSESAARRRLKQIEYFKHLDKSDIRDVGSIIDLTQAEELAYSAIMRQMRQQASEQQVRDFLKIYKLEFDKAVKKKFKQPDKIALQNALVKFDKIHKIKLDKELLKNAATAELGNARAVGAYLANIVRFILSRVPLDKRTAVIESLKHKFSVANPNEIADKNLPYSAAIAQSITFVKHVLFNQEASYVREVLNNLVSSL